MCGFVVLHSALSMPHVQSLASAYADLPELVTADLRDGRREQLLPFAPPFSDDALLHNELWTSVAADYLGATELELDAVTAVLAPEGSVAQELHRDVTVGPAAVLSVHIPLVRLPSGGGTLALQPASHLTDGVECDAATPPVPIEVPIAPGSMILYDARACHFGGANSAVRGVRPVLYLLLRKRELGVGRHNLPFTTGYEPLELTLRFGKAGRDTVNRYRRDFRAKRAAATGTNYTAPPEGEDDSDGAPMLFPLRGLSPHVQYTSDEL